MGGNPTQLLKKRCRQALVRLGSKMAALLNGNLPFPLSYLPGKTLPQRQEFAPINMPPVPLKLH